MGILLIVLATLMGWYVIGWAGTLLLTWSLMGFNTEEWAAGFDPKRYDYSDNLGVVALLALAGPFVLVAACFVAATSYVMLAGRRT